jgi:hypothetical protein
MTDATGRDFDQDIFVANLRHLQLFDLQGLASFM